LRALAELVWNAVDADAREVRVEFQRNPLSAVERILVSDNGSGIPCDEIHLFSSLGGSWKANRHRSGGERRILHGKNGEGRFRAFALGELVNWTTYVTLDRDIIQYSISGSTAQPGRFAISDNRIDEKAETGTLVAIDNVPLEVGNRLNSSTFVDDLARVFAPYLAKYRNVDLILDGRPIDARDLIHESKQWHLRPIITPDGTEIHASLEVIEWTSIKGRSLYLCDEDGFALSERPPEIRAPGFHFGAYLKSQYFRSLDEGNLIDIDLSEGLGQLVQAARSKLQEHFRAKEKAKAPSLIRQWKDEKSYPYVSEPSTAAEKSAQRVFNMFAVTMHEYVSGFDGQDRTGRALSFRLLREAIEGGASVVARIFAEVLTLPKHKQQELSHLLDRTKLSNIIDMAREIDDRLNKVVGLRALVSSETTRSQMKERLHIHQIVERSPWISGEEHALAQSESTLTSVLREHLRRQKRDERLLQPVLRADGRSGRIDIMLAKLVKRSGRTDDQHLIIELKRASKRLTLQDFHQLFSYANAVMRDPRFDKTGVSWEFWLVGVELDDELDEQVNSADRPPGCAHIFGHGAGRIWVKTWGQVLHDCLSRLEFVRGRLDFAVSEEDATKYLDKVYPKYVPQADQETAEPELVLS